jgi:serine/threonine-protein kinase HipA
MTREIRVCVDRCIVQVGRLLVRKAPHQGATFEYASEWLRHRGAFALDPELPLALGPQQTARALYRAFEDAAPGGWGLTLFVREEAARARREGRPPRTLGPVEALMKGPDETRLGALRVGWVGDKPEELLGASFRQPAPPLAELARLLAASSRVSSGRETDGDLALLMGPGTSLGGARPKASVRGDDDELLVAKFPKKDDPWPVTRWEAAALSLAKAAGVQVPAFRLELVGQRAVLLLSRFDRRRELRVPFMSAVTALSASGGEPHSYLELVDTLRRHGSAVESDLRELYRRMVFNVLVSCTDADLHDHGFLHDGVGWRLSPAYGLNPTPPDVRPRVHALALNETGSATSMDTLFGIAPRLGLSRTGARAIAREVAAAVRTWQRHGKQAGLGPKEIDRMRGAFEHEDLDEAAR